MRATLAAAAAVATLAAPAAAECLVCASRLTADAGAVTFVGRGLYPNNRLVARCTYDGGSLVMSLTATADGGDHISVEGECVLYGAGAAGVWTAREGAGPVLTEEKTRDGIDARPAQLCFSASAYWQFGWPDEDSVSFYECVEATPLGG